MLKTNHELLDYVVHSSEVRLERKWIKTAVLAILGGAFISLGALGNIVSSAELYFINPGFAKFIGASVFPVGLIAIVLLGLELFTSNCLMTVGYVEKKINIIQMIKILILVWLFNLVGALFIAYISFETHSLSDAGLKLLSNMAEHKVNASAYDIFLKAILCNVLVCGASLLGYIAKDGISKIFGIWFPIMLFIILGYDHVVANMLYLPLAYFNHLGNITILEILYNFTFATIGNFIGGGFVIGLALWYSNKK